MLLFRFFRDWHILSNTGEKNLIENQDSPQTAFEMKASFNLTSLLIKGFVICLIITMAIVKLITNSVYSLRRNGSNSRFLCRLTAYKFYRSVFSFCRLVTPFHLIFLYTKYASKLF